MSPSTGLRARESVAEHRTLLFGVLTLVVLVGVGLTYTAHVEPGTHTEERTVSSWSTNGSFQHQANVVRVNPVFPMGTSIGNRSVYFSKVTPELVGEFVYRYRASESGELDVGIRTTLVSRAVEREGTTRASDGQTVLWRTRRSLSERERTIASGERVTVPFGFDVNDTRQDIRRVQERLGADGAVESLVVAEVSLSGTVNGAAVDRTERYVLRVDHGDLYRVETVGNATQRFETTREVRVPNDPSPLVSAGGPVLLAGGAVLLVSLIVGRSREAFTLTETERERLNYERSRNEFDEWISVVRLPPGMLDGPAADTERLSDLVDIAIDTDQRVVEDPVDGTAYVLDDALCYRYQPPPSPDGVREQAGTEAGTGDASTDGDRAE